ncbi:MAG: hypothetical protein IJZ28_05945 [Clostridia bacterium]|nr:hypothetical protein [Clostridia bacterium]
MKKGLLLVVLTILLVTSLVLASCYLPDEWGVVYTYETAHAKAQELGYTGSLQEFIDSIKGKDGTDGADGIGIQSVKVNEQGNLVVTLTDSTVVDCGSIKGPQGEVGPQGPAGEQGTGILSIEKTATEGLVDTYTIYFTNGTQTTFNITNGKNNENIIPKPIEIVQKGSGYVLPNIPVGESVSFGTFSTYTKYLVPAYVNVTITMKTGGSYGFARTDENNLVIESCSNANHGFYTFEALDKITYLYVSDAKVDDIKDYTNFQNFTESSNYWTGKNIWWCGTSIPAGGYPLLVGDILGANVYQEAVGGSMIRANVSAGDYNGANISNITSSLSMTIEEAKEFISNYDLLKSLDNNQSWPETLSDSNIKRILSGTFETKLLPYLDGTKPMPDLFVIDHGHNDWKYKDKNGNIDIELEPTVENIKNGFLAEDIYMTANNYENLKKYFGDLTDIPQNRLEEFVASVNRNCFKGAVNFILTLILKNNPHARIVFISNYEYENGYNKDYSNVVDAQISLAKEWCFPIFEIYQYLGYSDKIIPGSKGYMASTYPNYSFDGDVTMYEIYNVDKVHPSSDTTGTANNIYAGLIAEFLKTIR